MSQSARDCLCPALLVSALVGCAVVLPLGARGAAPDGIPPEVRVAREVAFLGEGRAEKADLYSPSGKPGDPPRPAVLVIHGGGWVGGDKSAAREVNICTVLASHGYVAMSINYRLGPKNNPSASWPQNIRDCKAAVRWLRANAGRLGIAPARIGVIGSSAGGHLASLLGATGNGAPFDDPAPAAIDPAGVSAVVALYAPIQLGLGPIDASSDLGKSPFAYLDPGDPPFLLIHGTADTAVDPARSREFAEALDKAGVRHELVLVAGAGHSFDLQPPQRDLRPLVLAFLDRHLQAPGNP